MKKFIAILLITILSIGLLTACSATVPTRSIRWDASVGEELVYDVRVVDSLQYSQTSEGGVQTYASADVTLLGATVDQIKPISASGTYKTKIAEFQGGADQSIITTELNITEIYDSAAFDAAFVATLKQKGMLDEENTTSSKIAIKTVITSSCVVKSVSLSPVSSEKTVKGVYIGKARMAINDYSVTCSYNNGVCTTKFVNKMDTTTSFEKNIDLGSAEYFDNEEILYVTRAYTPAEFSERKNISIIDPLINQSVVTLYMQTASYSVYFSETNKMATSAFILAPLSSAAMYVYETTAEQQLFLEGAPRDTNKIVKIQQGYLVYTLCEEDMNETLASIEARKANEAK